MERHDALSALSPATDAAPIEAEPPRPKRGPKLPPLLKALAAVHDDSLAFLYGGPEQGPGDYERNKAKAPELRRHFTAFCETNPHFANWRQAWASFIAQADKQDEADRLDQVRTTEATEADSENGAAVAAEISRQEVAIVIPTNAPSLVIVQTPVSATMPAPTEPTWRARMRRMAIYG